MSKNRFIHLDVHSEYSLLNSIFKLQDIQTAYDEMNLAGIGVADFNVLHKPYTFQKMMGARKHCIGVKFIVKGLIINSFFTLLIYPKSYEGYLQLVKLSTIANSGDKPFPYLEIKDIEKYHKHLICLSGGNTGELFQLILKDRFTDSLSFCQKMEDIFGHGNFYVQLTRHFIQDEDTVDFSDTLNLLVHQMKLPTVATNDVFYWKKEWAGYRDIAVEMNPALQNNKDEAGVQFTARYVKYNNEFYLKSPDEMFEAFKKLLPIYPDCFINTYKIFEQCSNVTIEPQNVLPQFPVPSGYTSESYFDFLVEEGFNKRLENHQFSEDIPIETYKERLEYEKGIIKQMGFVDYHMIVQDFINWAKDGAVYEHPERYFPESYFPDYSKIDTVCTEKDFPIIVGPGRGSAAGSLVCYCLHITDMDPIANKLLFERFLNPERVSMPDIDVDLPNYGRHYVVTYLQNKYGFTHVSQIATFQTMSVKSILRAVGKRLGFSFAQTDMMSKNVPRAITVQRKKEDGTIETVDKPVELMTELEDVEFFREKLKNDPKMKELFEIGKILEGLPKSTGKHAAGCIICRIPIDSFVPLMEVDGVMVTQYEKHDAEDIGLLKMDLLGLLNLDIIKETFDLIEKESGKVLSLESIPNNDPDTFKLFQDGNTGNVFQFEGSGMKQLLRRIHPTSTEHLNAACALYRPGPMQFIDVYLRGRQDPSSIQYPDKSFEEVTKDTYGILVYQEQVMQLVQKMAGFTLGEADILRRGIGKKEEKLILENRKKFVAGGIKTSRLPEEKLNEIYDTICKFASYGFNRSHSCAYSWISYICGYLKAHYPCCYMAANLTMFSDNNDKLASTLAETKRMGIEILRPDIHKSKKNFYVEDHDKIRYSFGGIKGIGDDIAQALENIQPSDTFYEYMLHIPSSMIRLDKMTFLIDSGVFDDFGKRKSLVESSQIAIDTIKLLDQWRDAGICTFADMVVYPEIDNFSEYPLDEKIEREKNRLQIALSGHPVEALRSIYKDVDVNLNDLPELAEDPKAEHTFLLQISNIHTFQTKKNHQEMAFVQLEDEFQTVEGVFFPDDYKVNKNRLEEKKIYLVTAQVQVKDGNYNLVILNVDVAKANDSYLYILSTPATRKWINELAQYNGSTQVLCVDTYRKEITKLGFGVDMSEEVIQLLKKKGLIKYQNWQWINPYIDKKNEQKGLVQKTETAKKESA